MCLIWVIGSLVDLSMYTNYNNTFLNAKLRAEITDHQNQTFILHVQLQMSVFSVWQIHPIARFPAWIISNH